MAAETKFYTLYKVTTAKTTQLVILKVLRPEYSNTSQSAEDAAYDVLAQRQKKLISSFCEGHDYTNYAFLAEWSGFPEGDIFYRDIIDKDVTDRDIAYSKVEVWIAMYKDNRPFFSFGIAETEEAFWKDIKELFDDGDCANYPNLIRPAIQETVIFIQ